MKQNETTVEPAPLYLQRTFRYGAHNQHRITLSIKDEYGEKHDGSRHGSIISTRQLQGEEEDMTRGFYTLSKKAELLVSGSRGWREFSRMEHTHIIDMIVEMYKPHAKDLMALGHLV